MKISKTKQYEKDYKKKLVAKHKLIEMATINKIEDLILDSNNLKSLMLNPLSKVYSIEQKEGILRKIFTAKVNSKIRLHMKPIGEYPYNQIEIEEIEFITIDDKHYGDG